jgi:hypothetical protein
METNTANKTEFTLYLSIGYSGSDRTLQINVLEDYDLEDWQSMTEKERQDYLNDYAENWANNYIDIGWE